MTHEIRRDHVQCALERRECKRRGCSCNIEVGFCCLPFMIFQSESEKVRPPSWKECRSFGPIDFQELRVPTSWPILRCWIPQCVLWKLLSKNVSPLPFATQDKIGLSAVAHEILPYFYDSLIHYFLESNLDHCIQPLHAAVWASEKKTTQDFEPSPDVEGMWISIP